VSLDVELVGDDRVLPDQPRNLAQVRQLVGERDEAEAFLRVVRDPTVAVGQLRQVRAQLVERRRRVVEVPDQDARDQKSSPRGS
jgi:hypothetical protein